MITVDSRTGSVELADCLRAMHMEVEVKRIPFGDFSFAGHGPKGPCTVGIERKRLRDMLCCIQDSRFAAHQLPGMVEMYDCCYLIVEGRWSVDTKTEDLIEVCKRTPDSPDGWRPVRLGPSHEYQYRELDNYLNTIATMSSCRVKVSTCPAETVAQIVNLFHWYAKPWGQHQSLKVLRKEPPKFSFHEPSVCQLMAAQLPGVGYERSAAAAARFKTPVNMVLGTTSEWAEVSGIGGKTAAEIVKALSDERYKARKQMR